MSEESVYFQRQELGKSINKEKAMNMKNAFKFIGVSTFALALVFSGCGKGKKSSSGSSGSQGSSKEEESETKPEAKSESKSGSGFGFGSGSLGRAERVLGSMGRAGIQAEASAMATQGRKLIQGIIEANIDRQGKADPLWPKEKDESSSDEGDQDIASKCGSATEYFNALFDVGHYGTAEWEPAVDGELLSALWGAGVPEMSVKPLTDRNVAWNIALNVLDETSDFMPVLISANFNPKLLAPGRFDGMDDTPLPIGPESGAAKSMFGDEAIVIVRRSGAAEVIKKKDLTRATLYNKQAFDDTFREKQIKWLTPTGVVTPVGHE